MLKKKNGKTIIVEIKAERFREERKEMALKELVGLNPSKLNYEIVTTEKDEIKFENFNKVKKLIYEGALE